MSDIIGVIQSVEDDEYQGKAHKKVTLGDGQVLKVKYGREGCLKAKWGLLKEGVAIKFTMRDFTTPDQVKIPFVFDIATVELPPAKEPAPLLEEHQKEIDKAVEGGKELEKPPPAPQAVGMWTKEIGDMIRANMLMVIFGKVIGTALMKWYRQQGLGITRIEFDGKDLPTFEEHCK